MGDALKRDAELVTHNALGFVLDHPHRRVSSSPTVTGVGVCLP